MYRRRCIPIKKLVPNIEGGGHGWFGKSKGVFQILWERGWIKPGVEYQKDYTMPGRKDEHDLIRKEYSLNHLIRKNEDFMHEKTLLVHYGEELGCIIDCTPEIAGDGIEFDWAMCKLWYRKQPWEDKKKKENFEKLVNESMSDKVLSIERTRLFSGRSRLNMFSYYILDRDGDEAPTPSDVKKYKDKRKSHTCCLDEEHGYFSAIVRGIMNGTGTSTS